MTRPSPGPRERLLTAGQHLFYARGVAVEVDVATQDDRHPARTPHDLAALALGWGGASWR
ncbi:hypothetical protein [Actinopolymorpha pittospori]|uniref:Uncharacterized protein n=1 Tax=Actinopolymorpha pittospori TaxID=648752 RepID=A0A927MST7_9ACTN|nr:hypothetical protein [Actinopolymorpha pittospori]MBE1605519.1 hypothetical protein [Actinopolymorpha pittospori]